MSEEYLVRGENGTTRERFLYLLGTNKALAGAEGDDS